MALPHKTPFF